MSSDKKIFINIQVHTLTGMWHQCRNAKHWFLDLLPNPVWTNCTKEVIEESFCSINSENSSYKMMIISVLFQLMSFNCSVLMIHHLHLSPVTVSVTSYDTVEEGLSLIVTIWCWEGKVSVPRSECWIVIFCAYDSRKPVCLIPISMLSCTLTL